MQFFTMAVSYTISGNLDTVCIEDGRSVFLIYILNFINVTYHYKPFKLVTKNVEYIVELYTSNIVDVDQFIYKIPFIEYMRLCIL